MKAEDYLPLTPAVLNILLALADGEQHGYGIMQDVERSTNGDFRMGSGTLYGTLKRLLASALVAESASRPDPKLDDERRRYYRLTPTGRRVLAAELDRLRAVLDNARARKLLRREARS